MIWINTLKYRDDCVWIQSHGSGMSSISFFSSSLFYSQLPCSASIQHQYELTEYLCTYWLRNCAFHAVLNIWMSKERQNIFHYNINIVMVIELALLISSTCIHWFSDRWEQHNKLRTKHGRKSNYITNLKKQQHLVRFRARSWFRLIWALS